MSVFMQIRFLGYDSVGSIVDVLEVKEAKDKMNSIIEKGFS